MTTKPTYEDLENKVHDLEKNMHVLQDLETELRENKDRYKRMIESVTNYVFSVKIENSRPLETLHNPVCEAVTGYTLEDFTSDPFLWINMVPPEDQQIVKEQAASLLSGDAPKAIEHRLIKKGGATIWVSNTPVPYHNPEGQLISYDGLVSDITERKLIEEEREKLIDNLQKALEEIKTLRGIIPICSHCKKIRDDKGLWNQLEAYIRNHSDAQFSHGICPECREKYYSDLEL